MFRTVHPLFRKVKHCGHFTELQTNRRCEVEQEELPSKFHLTVFQYYGMCTVYTLHMSKPAMWPVRYGMDCFRSYLHMSKSVDSKCNGMDCFDTFLYTCPNLQSKSCSKCRMQTEVHTLHMSTPAIHASHMSKPTTTNNTWNLLEASWKLSGLDMCEHVQSIASHFEHGITGLDV